MNDYKSLQFLKEYYIDKNYSIAKIAELCGVGETTISRHIHKCNLYKQVYNDFDDGVNYKIIDEYPCYKVGDDGSMWSCLTNGGKVVNDWKRIKPHGNKESLQIALFHNGKKKQFPVHRLVLTAFVSPCPEGMECCHNDGNGRNNKLSNLRWDTHKNNILDKVKHGTIAKGERSGQSKFTDLQVIEIKHFLNNGCSKHRLSRLLNVTRRAIDFISSGRNWGHLDEQN